MNNSKHTLIKDKIIEYDDTNSFSPHAQVVGDKINICANGGLQTVTLSDSQFLWLLREGWKLFNNENAKDISNILNNK